MQRWIELQIETHADAADLVAASVAPLTGGVEVRDAGTILSTAEGRTCVVALCQPDGTQALLDAVDETLAAARAAGTAVDPDHSPARSARRRVARCLEAIFSRHT